MQESLQGSRRVAVAVACVAVAVGAPALAGGIAAGRSASPVQRARTPAPITSRYALAGRCVALVSTRYYFKATGLGTYMLYGGDGRLLGAGHRACSAIPAG